ncbi:MAG: thermonuclease family protein [Gemmatimonadaceae bacterium]|nr:thermonuclease family protein [Gemmatimonadaceae bacterium]MCW5826065.1 thermonuclease family protein [Gemmatimonadaceae bacterium]
MSTAPSHGEGALARVRCRVFGGSQGRGVFTMTMWGFGAMMAALVVGVPAPIAAVVFVGVLAWTLQRKAGTATYTLGPSTVSREFQTFSGQATSETRALSDIAAWKQDRELGRSLQQYEYLELDFRDGVRWIVTSRQEAEGFARFRDAFAGLTSAAEGLGAGTPALAAARRRPSFYRTWYGRSLAIVFIALAGGLGVAAGAGLIALTGLFKLAFVIVPGAVYMAWRSFSRGAAAVLLVLSLGGVAPEAQAQRPAPSAEVAVPAGMEYVASSRGQVYYWVGCNAWRRLARANLRFYATREAAEAAGYRVSGTAGCAGPSAGSGAPRETAPRATPAPIERSPSGGRELPCVLERVVDGDTIVCRGGRSVRLLLVGTPELSQRPFGPQAKAFVESRVPRGTAVTLELDVQERDPYGRTLAYVRLPDGTTLNELLLQEGFAEVSVYPPNVRHVDGYRALLREAKEAKRGLWATSAFECSPADHRRGRCE